MSRLWLLGNGEEIISADEMDQPVQLRRLKGSDLILFSYLKYMKEELKLESPWKYIHN